MLFGGGEAACSVPLYLDGEGSEFELEVAGSATGLTGLNLNVEPMFDGQRKGLLGRLVLASDADCPASESQVSRLWRSANLTTGDAAPLVVYPDVIAMQVPTLVELNLTELRLGWSASRFTAGEAAGDFSANVELTILDGNAVYSAPLFGLEGTDPIVNYTSTAVVNGSLVVTNGTSATLSLRNSSFIFELGVEGPEEVGDIVLNVTLTGGISAAGSFGCDATDCGPNGRCEIDEGSGRQVCRCSCGWSGPSCEVPSGFCPRFSDPTNSVTTTEVQSAPQEGNRSSADEQQQQQPADLATQCASFIKCQDERSKVDTTTGQCLCKSGWSGPDCDMCTTNSACNAFWDTAGGSCKLGFEYEAQSLFKVYACNLANEEFLATFIGEDLGFKCNTTGPRLNATADGSDGNGSQNGNANSTDNVVVGNSPYCDVNFKFQNVDDVSCRAWGCDFGEGLSRVECSHVDCECRSPGGCDPTINTTASGIKSITFDCDDSKRCEDCEDDEQMCTMIFGGIGFEIGAPCKARECHDPNAPYVISGGLSSGDDGGININALIISLPTVFVFALGILIGIPSVLLVRNMMLPPPLSGGYSRKHTKSAVSEIVFFDVHCSVPLFGRNKDQLLMNHRRSDEDDLESSSSMDDGVTRRLSSSQSQELTGLNPGLLKMMGENKKGFKSVLHGITGTFRQGELVGVMGPSGSGKTTFLSILSNVAVDGSSNRIIQGDILVNGRKQGSWLKRLVAFVPQEDKLLPTLTVRESIIFSAVLRLPGADWATIHRRTQDALEELSLEGVSRSLVGGVRGLRGISGGERRRVSIGMELVTDPSIVIMDEPLSGLDSYTALNLMHTLKGVSSAGRVVVLSMHQPAPAMLNMLDQVLLLAKGFQVYLGPPDCAKAYFTHHGFPCPDSLPLSEYMLQAVSNPHTLTSLLNGIFESSAQQRPAILGDTSDVSFKEGTVASQRGCSVFSRNFGKLAVLVWRGFVDIVRNPSLLLSHVVVSIVIGLMCGIIFWDAGLDITGAQNRLGGIFFLLAFLGFSSLTTIDLFHSERDIAVREIKAGYYSPFVYLTSKLVLDALLLRILPALLLGVPLNIMMDLQSGSSKFLIYIFTVNAFNLVIGAMAMVITILSPTPGTASLIINTFLLICLLFAGHLVHIPSIPEVVRWIHWLSVYSYAFQALAVNEFLGLKLNFTVPDYASVDGVDGTVFLSTIGIEVGDLRRDLVSLGIFYLISVILVFMSMYLSIWLLQGRKIRVFHKLPVGQIGRRKEMQMKKLSGTKKNEKQPAE